MTLVYPVLYLVMLVYPVLYLAVSSRSFQGEPLAGATLPTGDSLLRPVSRYCQKMTCTLYIETSRYVTDYISLMLLGAGPRHLACCVASLAR